MTCKIAAMVCKIFPFADYFCNGMPFLILLQQLYKRKTDNDNVTKTTTFRADNLCHYRIADFRHSLHQCPANGIPDRRQHRQPPHRP